MKRKTVRYDFSKLAEAAYTGYVYKRKADNPYMNIQWSDFQHLSPELQAAWVASARAMVKVAKDARK